MTNLQSLLSRVEAATSGDRELDARLHVALFPDEQGTVHPGSPDGIKGSLHALLSEMDWPAWERLSAERGRDLGVVANYHYWPNYTESLDAALALVARVLPGAEIEMTTLYGVPMATLPLNGGDDQPYETARLPHGTLPLAVIAALLGALIIQETPSMSKYPTPDREGHFWAKLKLHDNPDLNSVDWEVVQVFENMIGDPCEADIERGYLKWMASVPGVEGGQPLDTFVWGPAVLKPADLS